MIRLFLRIGLILSLIASIVGVFGTCGEFYDEEFSIDEDYDFDVLPIEPIIYDNEDIIAEEGKTIKNVIIVIGDGMGPEHIAAGQYAASKHYDFTDWKQIRVNTDSLNDDGYASHTTDSSAAATALATGTLTKNGYVGIDVDGNELTTILDVAKTVNKSTGIVTTDKLYGGTPAGFSAHYNDRNNTKEILKSQAQSGIDFLCGATSGTLKDLKSEFEDNGYMFYDAFEPEVIKEQTKACCMFGMYNADANVSLKSATNLALDFLAKDEDGFVLVVEQANIDKYSHNNDFASMVKCVDSLNDTVEMLTDWADARGDTAILVTADHETGDLSVSSENSLANSFECNSGVISYVWESTGHTNADVELFTYGFDYDYCDCDYFESSYIIKNIEISEIVKQLITTDYKSNIIR